MYKQDRVNAENSVHITVLQDDEEHGELLNVSSGTHLQPYITTLLVW